MPLDFAILPLAFLASWRSPSYTSREFCTLRLSLVSHEDVAQDPDGSHRRGDVQPHEAGEADLLAARLDLHHVVLARQRELLAADGEVNVGQAGDPAAVDHVLPSHDGRAAEHLVDGGDLGGGAGDEAGAGVGDRLAAAVAERLAADFDGVHLELPVALLRHGRVGERGDEVVGVGAAEQQLDVRQTLPHIMCTRQVDRVNRTSPPTFASGSLLR